MELNLIKERIQNEAVEAWLKANRKGTLALATGTGKTFCFFKALLKTLTIGVDDKFSILFLAETTQRQMDLEADLIKFSKLVDKNILNFKIEFACYQSAYKWKGRHFDFVCCDEIHNSLTPSYYKFFENNTYGALLGLSATPDRTVKYIDSETGEEYTKGDLLDSVCPIVFSYSLNQSVQDNTSRRLNIYVINHQLDMANKNYLSGTKLKPFLTTERAAYDYWDNEFKKSLFIQDQRVKEFKIRTSSSARAKVLYKAKSKAESISKLLEALESKVLIFGNDLDALLEITPNTVSSRNTDKVNKHLREEFDKGSLDVMAANKLLTQGTNIKDLDNIILHSYYSKELQNVQKLGRLRNSDSQGNVFVFKTSNTNEVKWFDKMFENITEHNMIYCEDINDCIKKFKFIN